MSQEKASVACQNAPHPKHVRSKTSMSIMWFIKSHLTGIRNRLSSLIIATTLVVSFHHNIHTFLRCVAVQSLQERPTRC
jgi:hypothetical protein